MNTRLSKFQRIFHLPKMAAILTFRIFFQNAKHKNACISKTVLDRAISTKVFDPNCKTQKCLHFENNVRKSDFRKIFDPQGIC